PPDTTLSECPAEFFETLHAHDSTVSPLIRNIYSRIADRTATGPWLEDQFLLLAAALIKVHSASYRRASNIAAQKPATRVELYRRLLRGRDFMDSYFCTPLRLIEVARQACLSPYYFHRLFREVFHETPSQYLQRRRLAHARNLLERADSS